MKELRITNYELHIFRYVSIICFFLFVISLTSCFNKSSIQNPKFRITDDAGIVIGFDSIPKRIISLAPNITETVFAIGADSQLVGVTDLCDYPPEAKSKAKTGNYISPNYEAMTALNPDLVIINVESVSNPTYQALKNMGLKTFVSNAKDINGINKMINDFGIMTGRKNSSDSLIWSLNQGMERYLIRDHVRSDPALILISINPLMTTNGKTFINDILNLVSIDNMYRNESLDYPNINFEDVISKNPDYIIFPTDTSDIKKTTKFLDEIKRQLGKTKAVKNDRIILIDENIMFRPGPRVVQAANLLKEKFRAAMMKLYK